MFNVSVKCPNCNASYTQDWSEFITTSECIDEREMGSEIEHTIEADNINCPKCNGFFKVSGSIFEYPSDSYNHDTLITEPQ